MELIKNILKLPCHYFDLESERTCLGCLAGYGRDCLLYHPLLDCILAAGEQLSQNQNNSMGTRSHGKHLEKYVTEGRKQFVCPFQWNHAPKEDRSLQKNMFPDAGLACRRWVTPSFSEWLLTISQLLGIRICCSFCVESKIWKILLC